MQLLRWFFIPIVAFLSYFATKKQFPVHDHGIVIVTGASSGIGYHTAEYLARQFSFVVYATVLSEDDANRLNGLGLKNLRPIVVDVTQHDSCINVVNEIREHSQREQLPLVAVVHNAAISRLLPAEFHPLEDIKSMFDTNFFGMVDLVQLTLPLLRESKGRMVFVSSFSVTQPAPLATAYSASKAALESFVDALRREINPFGISASIVQCGFVSSEMTKKDEFVTEDLVSESDQRNSMRSLYSRLLSEDYRNYYNSLVQKADKPIAVAKVIAHAISNPYPFTRYYAANVGGVPTWLLTWFAWLQSDRFQDSYLAVK